MMDYLACRACLQLEEPMINLFEHVDEFDSDLGTLLQKFGGIKVDRNDFLPKFLCKECTSELFISAKFREKCLHTQQILDQVLDELNTTSSEEPVIAETITDVDNSQIVSKSNEKNRNLLEVSQPKVSTNRAKGNSLLALLLSSPSSENEDINEETEQCVPEKELGVEQQIQQVLPDNQIEETSNIEINQPSQMIRNSASNKQLVVVEMCENNPGTEVADQEPDVSDLLELVSDAGCSVEGPLIQFGIDDAQYSTMTVEEDVFENEDLPENDIKFLNESYKEIPLANSKVALSGPSTSAKSVLVRKKPAIPDTIGSHVNSVSYGFVCDDCGALFMQPHNLKRHIEKSHRPIKFFRCGDCEHCFVWKESFNNHMQICQKKIKITNNNDQFVKPMSKQPCESRTCCFCGKLLQSISALKLHIRTHTGERPYACEMCEKKFKTPAALKLHMKRHENLPDYLCHICHKTFYETSNLKAHLRTHTGERPHVCSVCNKSFTRVFLLESHMRTHTGERPFQCSYCERAFAQLCDLRNHISIHTGIRNYACEICSASFTKRVAFVKHMKRHNGNGNEAVIDFGNSLAPTDANGYGNDGFGDGETPEAVNIDGIDFSDCIKDEESMNQCVFTFPDFGSI